MAILMTLPDWTELNWYYYLAIGGVVVVVLALLLYFTPIARIKIPAILLGVLGGLVVGTALGAALVMAMIAMGDKQDRVYAKSGDESPAGGGGRPGMAGGGGGRPGMAGGGGRQGMGSGGGRPGMGGGPPGGGGGGRGPNTKAQLASLITKLDLLTHKSLAVTLDAEQKKKVRESVQKLDEGKELSDDEAKAKLDDLQKILNEDQRKTLEAAGYRWPAQGGGRGGGRGGAPETPPNPFREGENSEHLKSLLAELK